MPIAVRFTSRLLRVSISLALLVNATSSPTTAGVLAKPEAAATDSVGRVVGAPTLPNRYRVLELPQTDSGYALLADNSVLYSTNGVGVVKWQEGVTNTLTNTIGMTLVDSGPAGMHVLLRSISGTQYWDWINGTLTEIRKPGGTAFAFGDDASRINDAGQVVGRFRLSIPTPECEDPPNNAPNHIVTHIYRWQGGSAVDLGMPPFGTYPCGSTLASSIGDVNASGQVAGSSSTQDTAGRWQCSSLGHPPIAYVWNGPGSFTRIGDLGGGLSGATAISNAGMTAGTSSNPGATNGGCGPGGSIHAFSAQPGGSPVALPGFGGDNDQAIALNNSGLIVGSSKVVTAGVPITQTSRAIAWTGTTPTDLNGRIDPATGWFLIGASQVNDAGSLLVSAFKGATSRALLLEPEDRRAWTLMYYFAGDNNLSNNYTDALNQLEAAADNPNVHIVVMLDQSVNGDTAYYKVKHDTNLNQFATYTPNVDTWPLGEQDTGNPVTLSTFVTWAKANFPARRYALLMDDHGGGVGGAMQDVSAGTLMTVKQIASALSTVTNTGTDRIDVLVMNACLMGMIEDAYEFRSFINHYVASENAQWTFTTGYFDLASRVTDTTSPVDLSTLAVNSYADDAALGQNSYTMSAVFPSRAGDVATATNALALQLTSQITTTAPVLTAIRQVVQRYDNSLPRNLISPASDQFIDLYDFAERVRDNVGDIGIKSAAQGVLDALNTYVFVERHQSFPASYALDGSHGVSIFYPPAKSSFYNGTNLAFAAGTTWPVLVNQAEPPAGEANAWGSLLVRYFQVTQPDGPDNPNPPPLVSKIAQNFLYLPGILH